MFKFEKLEQDYKVLSCKGKNLICNSYKTGLDKLYEDVNQKSKIIENYREQCLKLENDLIQERDKFINWSLQFSNKIESKMSQRLDEFNDSSWTKVTKGEEKQHQKEGINRSNKSNKKLDHAHPEIEMSHPFLMEKLLLFLGSHW